MTSIADEGFLSDETAGVAQTVGRYAPWLALFRSSTRVQSRPEVKVPRESLPALRRRQAIRLDCWYSVGPAMLRGQKGRELVGRMPADRVLTETDSSFAIFNDRAIQPWDVEDAVNTLAEICQLSAQSVEARLASNLRLLVQNEQPRP